MDRIIINKIPCKYGGSRTELICNTCQKHFTLASYRLKDKTRGLFCSHKCSYKSGRIGNHNKGNKSHIWKGGKITTKLGYILIYSPKHPFPNTPKGYVYEHRLIMEKHIGRYLDRKEFIHHINNIPNDNRIENLQLTNPHDHQKNHRLEKPHKHDPLTGRFI
jgi:hypothetical protein